jgi:hypothetical protein
MVWEQAVGVVVGSSSVGSRGDGLGAVDTVYCLVNSLSGPPAGKLTNPSSAVITSAGAC